MIELKGSDSPETMSDTDFIRFCMQKAYTDMQTELSKQLFQETRQGSDMRIDQSVENKKAALAIKYNTAVQLYTNLLNSYRTAR